MSICAQATEDYGSAHRRTTIPLHVAMLDTGVAKPGQKENTGVAKPSENTDAAKPSESLHVPLTVVFFNVGSLEHVATERVATDASGSSSSVAKPTDVEDSEPSVLENKSPFDGKRGGPGLTGFAENDMERFEAQARGFIHEHRQVQGVPEALDPEMLRQSQAFSAEDEGEGRRQDFPLFENGNIRLKGLAGETDIILLAPQNQQHNRWDDASSSESSTS